jgi:hypothetical protein
VIHKLITGQNEIKITSLTRALRQTSIHEHRSSCDGNHFEETDNKFGECILLLRISNINIIQAIERHFTRVSKGTEVHIYAPTVANRKYPSNPNHAELRAYV